jgi:hypothetical protein
LAAAGVAKAVSILPAPRLSGKKPRRSSRKKGKRNDSVYRNSTARLCRLAGVLQETANVF